MDNWQYAADLPTAPPWRGQMTIPRHLSLGGAPNELRLVQQPVSLAPLRTNQRPFSATSLTGINEVLRGEYGLSHSSEAELSIQLGTAKRVSLIVGGLVIKYDRGSAKLSVDRRRAGTVEFNPKFPAIVEAPLSAGNSLRLHLLFDRDSVELFAEDGLVTITTLFFPSPGPLHLQFAEEGGELANIKGTIWDLKSAR